MAEDLHGKNSIWRQSQVLLVVTVTQLVILSSHALAYRPFDGTDAAVADPNELEIEFQPAGAQWQGSDKGLVGPWAVLNYGFADRWEAVLEGSFRRRGRSR